MSPNFLLEIRTLSKFYPMGHGRVDALKKISFNVKKGEFLGIMGPSGSGKSTLLHLLGCLDTPSEGHYFFDHQDISHLDDYERSLIRSTRIGFVFQSFNLIPQLNVYENVELPFQYQKNQTSVRKEKILQAIDRVGLSHRLYHLPTELSGGETQRVAIARALVIDPLVILADEPTGNLDSSTGKNILNLFVNLNQQGATIIIITHDENVGAYCQKLIRMRDGEIEEIQEKTKNLS